MRARKTVVVGTDGSRHAAKAVVWAAQEAARTGALLTILSVVAPPIAAGMAGQLPQEFFDTLEDEGREIVDAAAAVAAEVTREAETGVVVTTRALLGATAPSLVAAAEGAGLLVVGARGRGAVAGALLGSVSATVAQHAPCPVVVVRTQGDNAPVPDSGPVVVGVDGTENSAGAVAAAFREAHVRAVPLVAVHAWSDNLVAAYPGDTLLSRFDEAQVAKTVLSRALAGYADEFPGVRVESVVVMDRPADALVDWAKGAQLVVVGPRGRGGIAGLILGSTAAKVLGGADCPVLVAR